MAMLRIFKHYELNYALEGAAARKLSFSSYPGGRGAARGMTGSTHAARQPLGALPAPRCGHECDASGHTPRLALPARRRALL